MFVVNNVSVFSFLWKSGSRHHGEGREAGGGSTRERDGEGEDCFGFVLFPEHSANSA